MSKRTLNFIVIEDDSLSRYNLVSSLKEHGLVQEAENSEQARDLLQKEKFDIAWIDLDLEKDLAGLDLISIAKNKGAYTVVLSGREEDDCIVKAYNEGCEDYLSKPFTHDALELVLRKFRVLSGESTLRKFFSRRYVTQDDSLINKLKIINEVVATDKPVFLSGPTGTGKTLVAKLIHELIFETSDNFIHLNCSEIPENLLEAELFGYVKGAFSGADLTRKGKFELADKGTLFLDEIATMPMVLQKKILRAIDEKSFYPLGSEDLVKSNFRLVSATCENLEEMVKDGSFREDLYYRIEGYNIELPPLEKRKEDIDLLIKHFLRLGKRRVILSEDTKKVLKNYLWPGNIRELQKVVEMLKAKSHGVIEVKDLPVHIRGLSTIEPSEIKEAFQPVCDGSMLSKMHLEFIEMNGLKTFIDKIEEEAVTQTLSKNNNKVRQALSTLKLANSSFYRIMDRMKKNE